MLDIIVLSRSFRRMLDSCFGSCPSHSRQRATHRRQRATAAIAAHRSELPALSSNFLPLRERERKAGGRAPLAGSGRNGPC